MSDIIVAPQVRELSALGRQLAAWMGSRMPNANDIQIGNLAYPRGAGLSHETILFDATWIQDGRAQKQGCVVRIKPTRNTVFPDNLFDQQYQVMRLLNADGRVRVARPMWVEEDPTILGAPFFVMEKKVGRVPVSMPPYAQQGWVAEARPEQRSKLWENGVRQLATIQSIPLLAFDFLKGATKGAEEGLEQEWDKYVRFAAWVQQDRRWPMLDAALERLRRSWPANQPAGLVWGDARLGNMMFDDNFDVVAVMDWEQPSLGGALNDLAWCLVISNTMHGAQPGRPHLEGMGTREETIALWHEVTGLPTDDIEWYEDFTNLKLSCLSIRTAWLRGQAPPQESWLISRLKV
jgi:aminoglycoside phosphotransferase (APT) family kinase protein